MDEGKLCIAEEGESETGKAQNESEGQRDADINEEEQIDRETDEWKQEGYKTKRKE